MQKYINIADFDYNLDEHRIAKFPHQQRDLSKLLIYKSGAIDQDVFRNISNYLPQKTLLVMNNTRVIYARLLFQKTTGANVEIFCLKPYKPAEYNQNFASIGECVWECIVGNAKKWKTGVLSMQLNHNNQIFVLNANKIEDIDDKKIIKFTWNTNLTFSEVLQIAGNVPIPPYLNRQSEETDKTSYQTVYSKVEGSVAAPTAGLHFTHHLLEELKSKGFQTSELTLHVGAGTFKPVSTSNAIEHQMHAEYFVVTRKILQDILHNLGNITAVGTTSLRALESLYWLGVKVYNNITNLHFIEQYEPYKLPQIDIKLAINTLLSFLEQHKLEYLEAETQIMITPGYDFKTVNNLITNFHQPRSTLLLLIAAFVGEDWRKIYDYALKNDFRFLSYGDSSLLIR